MVIAAHPVGSAVSRRRLGGRGTQAIEAVISDMVDDQALLSQIERKAHDGLTRASKRHADLAPRAS